MSNEELARRIYDGDNTSMEALYNNCRNLIIKYANSFYRLNQERCNKCGVCIDDLISEGFFVLLDAVKAYCEQDTNYKYTAFLNYPFKNRYNSMIGYRSDRGLKEPLNQYTSFNEPVQGYDGVTLADTIEDKDAENKINDINDNVSLQQVFPMVKEILTPGQFDIIEKHYRSGLSLLDIAEESGEPLTNIQEQNRKAFRELRKPEHKKLRGIYFDVIDSSYNRGGFSRFDRTWTSSTEWAALQIAQINPLKETHQNS